MKVVLAIFVLIISPLTFGQTTITTEWFKNGDPNPQSTKTTTSNSEYKYTLTYNSEYNLYFLSGHTISNYRPVVSERYDNFSYHKRLQNEGEVQFDVADGGSYSRVRTYTFKSKGNNKYQLTVVEMDCSEHEVKTYTGNVTFKMINCP